MLQLNCVSVARQFGREGGNWIRFWGVFGSSLGVSFVNESQGTPHFNLVVRG